MSNKDQHTFLAYEFLGIDSSALVHRAINMATSYAELYSNPVFLSESTFENIANQMIKDLAAHPDKLAFYASARSVSVCELSHDLTLPAYMHEFFMFAETQKYAPIDRNILSLTEDYSFLRDEDYSFLKENLRDLGMAYIFVMRAIVEATDCFAKFAPEPRPGEALLSRMLKEIKANPETALEIVDRLTDHPGFAGIVRKVMNIFPKEPV